MSDSDELPNNVFTFQNESTTVCARGPNINASNIGLSFRSNVLTSTMNMPKNFEQRRYAESSYDSRSMYYRRHTSPMSIHSACDVRERNASNSYYPGGISSQRSIVNGRSGSPMSFRSTDTNASVSAADIAMAFKNVKFNKYDLRVIKDAYNKYMKSRVRKRIEKRRNLRLFLKGTRRKSGYDSGEQGSDSSISSDDCRSIKTAGFKESMSSCRSTKTDLTDFRKTIKECNIYRDCTENVRQSTFRNIVNIGHEIVNNNNSQSKPQNLPTYTQKDRFKNGFLLPSQRFNRSVAESAIPENMERFAKNNLNAQNQNKKPVSATCETDSEQEIFAEVTVKDTHNIEPQLKRSIDNDVYMPDRKKCKISPIHKENTTTKTIKSKQPNVNAGSNINDFIFAKPSFPIKKSANVKTKEKLISKSSQPLDKTLSKNISNVPPTSFNTEEQLHVDEPEKTQNSSSDLSMRPSFIKRKLFTQKLDVTEKKNVSCDSLNSPQSNLYSILQNDKPKARKLVTQSCLRREVHDENNLMDLIHKIVPPDQMNVTNQTIRTEVCNDKNITEDLDDKWDVTSIISTHNKDNVSDTYTDEEILEAGNNSNITENISRKPVQNVQLPQCKILLDNIPANSLREQKSEQNSARQDILQNHVQTKSFWDTDFESDIECHTASHLNRGLKENHQKAKNLKDATSFQIKSNSINNKIAPVAEITKTRNNTVESFPKFNITNLKIRSHRTPKRKKCCMEIPEERNAIVCKSQNNKLTSKDQNKKTEKMDNQLLNKPNELDCADTKASETEVVHDNKKEKPINKNRKKALNKNNDIDFTANGSNNSNVETCLENNNKRKQTNRNKTKGNKKVNKSSVSDSSIIDNINSKTDHDNKRKQNIEKTKPNKLSYESNIIDSTFNASNDLTDSENLNKSGRPLRSCRNKTLDSSKVDRSLNKCNLSNRSLRSRQIDLSSSFNKEQCRNKSLTNNSRAPNKKNNGKLRKSDVSFSLASVKKSSLVNKKSIANKAELANSWVSAKKDIETSDVSFSLTVNTESPVSKINSNKGKAKLAKSNSGVSKAMPMEKRQISEVIVKNTRRIMIQNQKGIK